LKISAKGLMFISTLFTVCAQTCSPDWHHIFHKRSVQHTCNSM